MKNKFNADDNSPLNKPLKLHLLKIIFRCISEEDDKFYPVCMSYMTMKR